MVEKVYKKKPRTQRSDPQQVEEGHGRIIIVSIPLSFWMESREDTVMNSLNQRCYDTSLTSARSRKDELTHLFICHFSPKIFIEYLLFAGLSYRLSDNTIFSVILLIFPQCIFNYSHFLSLSVLIFQLNYIYISNSQPFGIWRPCLKLR